MRKLLIIGMMVFVAAVQAFACAAITKKGTQCKRAPVPGSSYCWQHGGSPASSTTSSEVRPATTEVARCKATTKAGTQCKRKAKVGSEYCWQHDDDDTVNQTNMEKTVGVVTNTACATKAPIAGERVQCDAITKSGKRCSRKAQPGSMKCWQHQ